MAGSMRNAANAIGADLRILFVEDEPMDVLGEQQALKRDGLEFASRVAVSEVELTRQHARARRRLRECAGCRLRR